MDLRAYLDCREIEIAAFAAEIGVTQTSLYRYLAGDRTPRKDVLLRIQAATRGEVSPNDFFRSEAI